jgi:signal transduction histidine kinase
VNLHPPTLLAAHAWVLLALTIMVGALYKTIKAQPLRDWFYSDIFALISIITLHLNTPEATRFGHLVFSVCTSLTIYFRILSVSSDGFSLLFRKYGIISLAILFLINLLLLPIPATWPAFLNSSAYVALCAIFLHRLTQPSKNQNKIGTFLLFLSAGSLFSIGLFRVWQILIADQVIFFAMTPKTTLLSSALVLLIGVVAHIGFLIIVFENLSQEKYQAMEIASREIQQRSLAELREQEILKVSQEQKALLDVLTHEVRQPLNNASATLQSINNELDGRDGKVETTSIARVQGVIDRVTTSLSNALVAATILERRDDFNPVRCETISFVEMVALDFNVVDRNRIEIEDENTPRYMTADPILLRIALRNLIENAIKYSDSETKIQIQVEENEQALGVSFSVLNQEADQNNFDGINIFERYVRGPNVENSGSGMGLYIASEVAKLHHGSLSSKHSDGKRIFTLFIKD